MAAMQFDLVAPEATLASMQVDAIDIPGAEGDFTAMVDHAPLLTTLRPGFVKVTSGSEVSEYLVTGGFVEVTPSAVAVLAEQALPKGEVTRDFVQTLVQGLDEAAQAADGAQHDAASKRASDARMVLDQL